MRDQNGWETVSTDTPFSSPHLSVAIDNVRTPTNHEPRKWTVAHRKAAVAVAAMTREEKFVLILQERIPIRAAIWEMPAGQIDESLEPDEAARREVTLRELREETGYELEPGGELTPLGYYFCSPGFTDEHCYLFLARPVRPGPGARSPQPGEGIIDCREFSLDLVRKMISGGDICDANTLSVWARLVARGEILA